MGDRNECDVQRGSPTFDSEVVSCLALKGFCTVDLGFGADFLREAAREVERISRFAPPPEMVAEGLLGVEGSGEVAELEGPGFAEVERTDGQKLRQLDAFLTWTASVIETHLEPGLGFACGERTVGLLHRSGRPVEEPPDLTEKTAARWLNIFRRHRLMCVICLGRHGGSFTLQPFDDESEEETVNVRCGQMLILRADALSHTYSAAEEGGAVLSCWLLQADRSGARGAFADGRVRVPLIPVAQDLVEWASNRLAIIKEQQDAEPGSLAEMDIPRGWKLLASHSVSKGVQVAVRGIHCNVARNCETLQKHFCAVSQGTDFAMEVPSLRWDHFAPAAVIGYDPDPDCWRTHRGKTNVRHGTFLEGVELFDNKFFNMSVMEANVTDPCQRMALESAYSALHMAGYVRKQLMQAFIGVYQGHTASDWDKVEHQVAGGCAGSYSPTIASNRINFSLGLMGPSFTIDLEGAASLAAIYQGCHDLLPSEDFRKPLVAAGLAGGVTLMFAPYWWPVHNQFMNPGGRCQTFDEKAAGYIKGEGSALVVLKRHGEFVEGEFIADESRPNLALVPGFSMVNSGRAASLTAPSAPAVQQVVADCVRNASLSPLDVDAVECDGKGHLMHDAVEVFSMARQLRGLPGGDEEVLALSASKTKHGYCQETAGVAAFVTALLGQRGGHVPGNLHLKKLNPHAVPEDADCGVRVPAEALAFRCRGAFTGVSAYGFGGSNVHTLVWAELSEENWPAQTSVLDRRAFSFWPGGGGELEEEAQPLFGYSVVGSWSCWEAPERMREDDGSYTYVLTLGENRFEDFQIWVDGDSNKVLCPAHYAAGAGAPVLGPLTADESRGRTWRVDGRPQPEALRAPLADWRPGDAAAPAPPLALADQRGEAGLPNDQLAVGGGQEGLPGDRYRVRLQVAGKWRTVVWHRIASSSSSALAAPVPRGRYYVAASWDGWSLAEMTPDAAAPGRFFLDVTLKVRLRGGEFKIIRNKDASQSLYPAVAGPAPREPGESAEVLGPDDGGQDRNWTLDGQAGRAYRIEFERQIDGARDFKTVLCKPLEVR